MTSFRILLPVLGLAALLSACPGETRPTTDAGPGNTDAGCNLDTPYTPEVPAAAPLLDDGSAPDLTCTVTAQLWPASMPVAMGGCLDVFGVGDRIVATTLMLAVYDVDQNPATEAPAYGEVAVQTSTSEAVACSKGAYYRISNIPTSTPLLVKVYDAQRSASMVVVDSYQYNVLLDPSKIEINGGEYVEFEANVIYSATYQSLPTLASRPIIGMDDISDGQGRGAIAGEVQDCDEKVLKNVVVTSPCIDDLARLVYTVGEDCDQPDRSRTASGECGTYAYLNVAPGQQLIEAWYRDGSSARKLGGAKIYVFPDAVTIYTPHGLDPVTGAVDAGLVDATAAPDATTTDTATAPDASCCADAALPPDAATTPDSASVEDATAIEDASTVEDGGSEDL